MCENGRCVVVCVAEWQSSVLGFGSGFVSPMCPMCPISPMCRISGLPGVALDDLVYIMTRLARQAEDEGFDKMFAAAEEATRVMKVRRRSKGCLQG